MFERALADSTTIAEINIEMFDDIPDVKTLATSSHVRQLFITSMSKKANEFLLGHLKPNSRDGNRHLRTYSTTRCPRGRAPAKD